MITLASNSHQEGSPVLMTLFGTYVRAIEPLPQLNNELFILPLVVRTLLKTLATLMVRCFLLHYMYDRDTTKSQSDYATKKISPSLHLMVLRKKSL